MTIRLKIILYKTKLTLYVLFKLLGTGELETVLHIFGFTTLL